MNSIESRWMCRPAKLQSVDIKDTQSIFEPINSTWSCLTKLWETYRRMDPSKKKKGHEWKIVGNINFTISNSTS